MIVGERLRVLREEKKFSQGVIEKRTGLLRCYISRVETDTQFRLSRRLKSSPALSKFRCTNSSTMVRSRPSCQSSRSASLLTTLPGAARAKRQLCFSSFDVILAKWRKATRSC